MTYNLTIYSLSNFCKWTFRRGCPSCRSAARGHHWSHQEPPMGHPQ
ncbi:MAG: hypothetical protein AVDCRST_MAG15-2967 [uncultured Rubellimicrobium sp.]|uniref:Uncharacterized protein n=1 Tax=uncultured Rubellimicrobium sp. TaxID=543078 RepID=A0A6J4Q762_9RHOB|nr:MAG: hypothetical protein AVDCRST_MAG15-2967 [uncultured Rubellimicrobium sp.]